MPAIVIYASDLLIGHVTFPLTSTCLLYPDARLATENNRLPGAVQ